MKRFYHFFIVFILGVGVWNNAGAQSPFHFGGKIGMNVSSLKVLESASKMDSIKKIDMSQFYGFHGGIWTRLDIKKFYIQPEVLFSMKGVSYDITKVDPNNVEGTAINGVKITLNNIDVPLMLGYYIVDLPVFKLRVNAGPIASFVIGGNQSKLDEVTQSVKDKNVSSLYKTANWGFQAGVGADIANLIFDLRFEGSLSKYELDMGDFAQLKQNIQLFQISIGYKIL